MTSNGHRAAAIKSEKADATWLIPPELGRRVVETADEGIWVLDDGGSTVFANPKMAAILGYPANELAALSVYDVLDEQGAAAAAGNLARRRRGHVDELECNFVRKDGSRTWVLMHASPLHDGAGDYLGSLCMVGEINERRRIEELLLESKQQLADGQRVAHLGSWEWEPASKRTKWSEEMFHLFGIAGGVLQAETFFDSALVSDQVHADDRHKFLVGAEALERGEPHFEHDARVIRPGGEAVWIRWRGKAVRDAAGDIVRVLGTAHDITATKRSEAELRTTSARYRLLQKMAFAANEASTLEGALQVAVDQICAHTGWAAGHAYVPSDQAIDGLAPLPVWHVDEPAWIQAFRTASMTMRDGESRGLARRVLVGGKPAWTDLRNDHDLARLKVPLALGFQGAFAFPVLVGDDVACVLEFFARRPIDPDEAALEIIGQVGTQLSRVAERVGTAADLAAARDAAMESSRLKSEFLATMSHEVRTPVNGIIGLTGLMLGTDLDSRQRQYADGVKGAGESLLTIINDILDFSKIEAGKLDLEVIDFDLVDVVEGAVELLAESARKKGLNLVATCHPDLPTALRGDPGRLGQILANLASNAVKFTREGEVIVQARLVESGDIGVVARFDVSDTGIGIAEEDMHRLFEPFSQVDASTTRIFGGTGLGLAISRQLVTAMGGELTVHSDVGRGTTFSFSLPLKRQPDTVGTSAKPTDHLLHGLPTLIVDDNKTNRMILFEQLASWQMQPVMVDGGTAALAELHHAAEQGEPYALALVDMCMPDIDGLDLARLISADDALGATSMVLLTSATDVRSKVARRAGFVDMLTKPVRQSQLYDCLVHIVAPPGPTEPKQGPSPEEGTHRGRILVVEDNATNQMVATGILDQLRYRSDVAADGLKALDALAAADYSAVLMDIQMPGMDGYEATGEIRRREGKARHTPIIAMTAHATPGDRDRCLAAGMDDYIAKPVRPRDVAAALTKWAQETEVPARPDPAEPPASDPIDEDRLAVLRQVNPSDGSLLPRLIEAFVGDLPGTLDEINAAIDGADDDALHRSAHRLKGAALTIGAAAVGAVCERLEGVTGAGDHEPRELRDLLATEIDRATEALRALASDRSAAG
jgi:hypothetical protein